MDKRINILNRLAERGVVFPEGFDGIRIGDEVRADRIEAGAVIHRGCIVEGRETLLCRGSEIGLAGGGFFRDVGLGPGASIQQGYAQGAVLLSGASTRGAAELRPACLLEEGVNAGHAVGLKMSLVLAHTYLGSLINFCDVLVQAGVDDENYTEVGSGAIHFNNSPALIKYPSLIGSVESVFHRAPLIFVGGMAKIVAPVSIGAGSTVAAGSRVTRSVGENVLHLDPGEAISRPAAERGVRGARWKLAEVIGYLANVAALRDWYRVVRLSAADGAMEADLFRLALGAIEENLLERFGWLDMLFEKSELDCGEAPSIRLSEALALDEQEARKGLGFVAEAICGRAGGELGFPERIRGLDEAIQRRGIEAMGALIEAWRGKIGQALDFKPAA